MIQISDFSSVQLLSHLQHFANPWTAAHQAFCSLPTPIACSNSCPSSRGCHQTISSSVCLILPPSIFPSIRIFPNESDLHIRWLKYWSFSFRISPSNEYSGLISFRIHWFGLLAVQGTLKSLQHHSSKASILQHSFLLYGPTVTSIHD